MAKDSEPEHLEHQQIKEEINHREAHIFRLVVGTIAFAAIVFGVLNGLRVIHM